ncbi:MAG TPA: helix-turn-helix domain-containing protein [Myxococcota bacterium]|nr:helix-turn-helix domain-containing protein [Myxococcota bacterium]
MIMNRGWRTAVAPGLRERNKREKLARIRSAARALFRKRGFEATTAREICERAGIGTGTLFLYVRDKRELLFLTFEEDARRIFAEGRTAAAGERELVGQLMALFGRFIAHYSRDVAHAKELVRELFFREHDPDGMGRLTLEFGAHVADLVGQAQARGELRSDVPAAAAANALFAHYAYWVQGWLGAGVLSRDGLEDGLRGALELQLEGLRPRAGRRER